MLFEKGFWCQAGFVILSILAILFISKNDVIENDWIRLIYSILGASCLSLSYILLKIGVNLKDETNKKETTNN